VFRKAVIVPLEIPLAICLWILVIVAVAGCQSQREVEPGEPVIRDVTTGEDVSAARIERTRQFLERGDVGAAAASLREVDISTVKSPPERFEWMILDAEISIALGAFPAAEARAVHAEPTNAAQRSRLALVLARLHAERRDYATASWTLIAAAQDDRSSGDLARSMVETAWRYAQRVPGHRITDRLRHTGKPSERAWWRLIQTSNEALTTREQQAAWEGWRTRHRGHVAARFLPRTLFEADQGPRSIALFLPFSGLLANAGETVRDGFLSGYFLSGAASRQSIQVYDTSATPIEALYRQAIEDGADAIVGPLSKEKVADIWVLDPSVPTLALNTVAVPRVARSHPIQFALTVEDEARAIARRIVADGRHRVIVLRSGESWTGRALAVLSEQLARDTRAVGSVVAAHDDVHGDAPGETPAPSPTRLVRSGVFLEGADITSIVGETLLIEESKQRHRRVERLVGDDVEFTPRRRGDIDAIIALVEGKQLASLKPALAFHFASGLPVYASSQAGRDVPNREDLELLRICDMPWRLYPPAIKADLREAFPNNRGTRDALFAFGLDAYRLVNQMSRLTASTDSRIMGSTGILELGPDGVIRRELVWALVKAGRFIPLPPNVATTLSPARDVDVATTGR